MTKSKTGQEKLEHELNSLERGSRQESPPTSPGKTLIDKKKREEGDIANRSNGEAACRSSADFWD